MCIRAGKSGLGLWIAGCIPMITGVRRHSHLRGNPSEERRNRLMDSCENRNDVKIEASGALTTPKSMILELFTFLALLRNNSSAASWGTLNLVPPFVSFAFSESGRKLRVST